MRFAALRNPGAARPPRRARIPALAAVVTAAVTATCLAGCSSGGFNGIYSIPLPGGANLGPHPYRVTAEFSNVVDLVPQSSVKVNDVSVGRVTSIYLPPHSWTARVTMLINGSVHLPANAIAAGAAGQPARRAVRGPVRAAGHPAAGPPGQRRGHPVVPHHHQRHRGGGLRRAVAAAQRRRHSASCT